MLALRRFRSDTCPDLTKKVKYTWIDGSLVTESDAVRFTSTVSMGDEFEALETPLHFFRYFFTADVLAHITEQTMLYSAQQRPQHPIKTSEREIEQFVGIALYMSLVRMASTRNYFSAEFRMPQIADTMTGKRFEELKRFLHLADNNACDMSDKLHKVRPFTDMLKQRFLRVPMVEGLSVDEQIVPFKGTSGLKQYIPMKPHKWGYKLFMLCGCNGFAYNFEVYTGKQDNIMQQGESDCGASGNVVIRLARAVPPNVHHKLYFDNYFNSPKLQICLAQRGVLSLGTVRTNRLPNCTLASDKELKKKGRGSHVEKVTSAGGVN